MIEFYLMIFACVLVALIIGFMAVTIYLGWVLIQHDLEEKQKGKEHDGRRKKKD